MLFRSENLGDSHQHLPLTGAGGFLISAQQQPPAYHRLCDAITLCEHVSGVADYYSCPCVSTSQ